MSFTACMIIIACLCISACAIGIPDADGWKPAPAKPCNVVVSDGRVAVCMTREEFRRWRQRNGL